MATLVILGNGFDLFHELPTAWKDYKGYLLNVHGQIARDFEDFPFLNSAVFDRWSDVEAALALEYQECLEDALGSCPLNLLADNPGWNDPAIDIEVQTGFINDFTGELFLSWLFSIDLSQARNETVFPEDAVFVTYNYTTVLEDRYGIPDCRILHIHGKASNVETSILLNEDLGTVPHAYIPDDWDEMQVEEFRDEHNQEVVSSEIQFGSPYNEPAKVRENLEGMYGDDDFYDVRVEPCVTALEKYSKAASKRLADNYPTLATFVERWEIDRVIVFGHSFCGVDKPYYEDIFVPRFGDRPWVFIAYNEGDADLAKGFVSRWASETMK
ncbi:AbiH family protein [Paratractidigestivibacter sp.]|uniref:AbiH family protein n=1 Tax=Paratractidigestivibacter sp. TaxID=2847316 RepID=UPI002AC93B62|nr:AbiH family protein [Paratractidigestivibacter sp.]